MIWLENRWKWHWWSIQVWLIDFVQFLWQLIQKPIVNMKITRSVTFEINKTVIYFDVMRREIKRIERKCGANKVSTPNCYLIIIINGYISCIYFFFTYISKFFFTYISKFFFTYISKYTNRVYLLNNLSIEFFFRWIVSRCLLSLQHLSSYTFEYWFIALRSIGTIVPLVFANQQQYTRLSFI